ncbi:TetM/TetW/TetO/TetS family tetracycline resistance ribosomal protection protein [Clostridium sp. AM33-3]|uniref:translation factor GTPase family protein n=1 Tax=Clostridium sp. AM33-3 TaxID=2292304 RepID=UPI000E4CF218|nr:TetM/TetW/TetO/TetS family tetracycline resistance ribosomal protection protein [Clostridium sp. AM33-3]RHT21028.1 GTP-binding protein [Clostridium sp. AM33-3]
MAQQDSKKAECYRCIGLLAHVDAGKTTLSEAILYTTGTTRKLGRVDNRDAYLDTYTLERERGITIFSKQAVCRLGDVTVTLLDTPGHVDFSAEMERTLNVLDYAVLVISGADGVQGHTETLWSLLKRYRVPTFLFINKMDQPGTVQEVLLSELQKRLSESCVDFALLDGKKENVPEEIWETIAMSEEELLEQYLENGSIPEQEIRRLIRQRKLFPCYFGSALKLKGVEELLNGLERWMGEINSDQDTAFGAKVFKISRDEQGSRLTHLKITSGRLKVKEFLQEKGKEPEKVNQIRIYSGMKYETVNEAMPGMICAVTGPLNTYPGQGIGTEAESELPVLEPVLTYRVELPEECDAHKMLADLRQLEEEEPELHITWNEQAQEIQVQVMGEVQIEVLKSLVAERFGVDIRLDAGSIVYKETITAAVEGVGHFEPLRHYAEVHLLMEPGEPGSGLQFFARCSEDFLDRNWQRLILTHLEEKHYRGVLTGSEITDMQITLIAGRAHQKHTEGGDFRQATYRAVRQGLCEAAAEGCVQLLEPYYAFKLEVPSEYAGRAMTDLERMKGTFEPPEVDGENMVLSGVVPVATMQNYQREVVSYTKGRGRVSCVLQGYFPCHNAVEVVQNTRYEAELDLADPTGSVFCAHGAGFVVPWYEVKHYMHIQTGLPVLGQEACAAPEPDRSGWNAHSGGGSTSAPFGADDKELEAIFTRTYGESKRKLSYDSGPRQVVYDAGTYNRTKKEEPVEEYLLVDGYNILYAWDELRELMKVTLDGARHRLMDMLCNYQGYRRCNLIVVFDAYKVAGGTGSVQDYHNIHVVYTKEAETADQYIEKFAHEMGRKYRVTVATSDGLEQVIIRSQGCLLMSASDLAEDMERVSRQIEEDRGNLVKPGKHYLFAGVEKDLAEYLEQVRLGKIAPPSEQAFPEKSEKKSGISGKKA